jgi:hypothetical protein
MDEQGNRNEKLGLVAMICGIVSIFIFPLAFGAAAIIFGVQVTGREEEGTRAYQNAKLGIVLGIVGLVLWMVSLVMFNYLNIDLGSMFSGSAQQPSAF